MRMRTAALLLSASGVVAVWVLCLMPAPPSGGSHYIDKLEHAGAYLLQVLAFVILFPQYRGRIVLAFLLQGALLEGLQALTTWRSAEWADMLANGLGVLLGVLLAQASIARRLSLNLLPRS